MRTSPKQAEQRQELLRRMGVLFQTGGLWSSMTLAENIGMLLEEYTDLTARRDSRGGLAEARAGGAQGIRGLLPVPDQRRHAEKSRPGAGHGVGSRSAFLRRALGGPRSDQLRLLDDLILELRDSLGATVVVVTHELASIFTIGNNSVFLDPDAKTMTASGDPKELLAHCPDPKVRAFLRRGEKEES